MLICDRIKSNVAHQLFCGYNHSFCLNLDYNHSFCLNLENFPFDKALKPTICYGLGSWKF